jgi:hypothetical protein
MMRQIMQFILIMMLFVTPPTLGSNRSWTLQSTQSIEFEDWTSCDDAIKNVILPAVKSTDTLALTAWCLPKSIKGKSRIDFFSEQDKQGGMKALSEKERDTKKVEFGSCYDYVPPPVGDRRAASKRNVTVGVAGKCHEK